MSVYEDNDKLWMLKGRYQKVCQFSSNAFWNNIGGIILSPTFSLGRSSI